MQGFAPPHTSKVWGRRRVSEAVYDWCCCWAARDAAAPFMFPSPLQPWRQAALSSTFSGLGQALKFPPSYARPCSHEKKDLGRNANNQNTAYHLLFRRHGWMIKNKASWEHVLFLYYCGWAVHPALSKDNFLLFQQIMQKANEGWWCFDILCLFFVWWVVFIQTSPF